jgi:hypothetical protein
MLSRLHFLMACVWLLSAAPNPAQTGAVAHLPLTTRDLNESEQSIAVVVNV